MEYVEIRIDLVPIEQKIDCAIFFWNRLKEDFTGGEEAADSLYLEAKAQNSDKEALINAYLQFVDAELARLNGLKAKQLGKAIEAVEMRGAAKREFEKIIANPALTPFLMEKVKNRLGLV